MPRFHVTADLRAHAQSNAELPLPEGPARHAQVLRLQPGDEVALFDGTGGQWRARISRMGRQSVHVHVLSHEAVEREGARAVHIAACLMSAERMDWLVEKATELGAAAFHPIASARSSLRLSGERAAKKRAHWQAVAAAASEQCGRNRVPAVADACAMADFLAQPASALAARAIHAAPGSSAPMQRWLLSLAPDAVPLHKRMAALASLGADAPVCLLSGPEGGLDAQEEAAARTAGWLPTSLGARTLRAETAPLAALACLALGAA